ncbi:hypothetical protein PoB_001236000 [Plakobranchus ocellatus]|uniref:Uncharacterized protein n=1 Tax=Plakobranchus ocellatus TaxID=259542 RepID=A0AAV3YTU2_9GAST|nr:hypothetical protein PoB_001236000 [Plakobranchus ocellatus]
MWLANPTSDLKESICRELEPATYALAWPGPESLRSPCCRWTTCTKPQPVSRLRVETLIGLACTYPFDKPDHAALCTSTEKQWQWSQMIYSFGRLSSHQRTTPERKG